MCGNRGFCKAWVNSIFVVQGKELGAEPARARDRRIRYRQVRRYPWSFTAFCNPCLEWGDSHLMTKYATCIEGGLVLFDRKEDFNSLHPNLCVATEVFAKHEWKHGKNASCIKQEAWGLDQVEHTTRCTIAVKYEWKHKSGCQRRAAGACWTR